MAGAIRTPTRQRSHAETRTAILAAARDILRSQGMASLSMRTLGKAVGLNAASLYGYFPSKDAVIAAIYDEKTASISDALNQERQRADAGLQRVYAVGLAYRRYMLNNPDYCQVFQAVMDGSFEAGAVWRERSIQTVLEYGPDIVDAIRLSELPVSVDPEKAIVRLWIALHGYCDLEIRHCIGRPQEQQQQAEADYIAYMNVIIAGISAVSLDDLGETAVR